MNASLRRWHSCCPLAAWLIVAGIALADAPVDKTGLSGGLCVQVGGSDAGAAVDLAKTGRFVVHVLADNTNARDQMRKDADQAGLYGAVSVELASGDGKLPYAENLVNVIVLHRKQKGGLPEVLRVVSPLGKILVAPGVYSRAVVQSAGLTKVLPLQGGWLLAEKPWPAEMDDWSHPRHSPTGNAVSTDTLVGPPRRIRWVAGPWQEVANLVSSRGKNFYGGVLARDAFNGLRLWERELKPTPSRGGFSFSSGGVAVPIAGDGLLFAFTDEKLQAFDAATGEVRQRFEVAGRPYQILYHDGTLISVSAEAVQAFQTESGKPRWQYEAKQPRNVVMGDDVVVLIEGNPLRGGKVAAVALEKESGKLRWRKDEFEWLPKVSRAVYHKNLIALEVSTINDDGPGNALHLLSANDGSLHLNYDFLPGMNHKRQARALFIGDRLWILHGGKDADKKRLQPQISSIDFKTGKVQETFQAGLAHCFPPVATPRYLLSGELDLTDLSTGQLDANRITKAACGRDFGWLPANGMIYVAPKHCVCWPMLRGYAALAPAREGGNPALEDVNEIKFPLKRGKAAAPPDVPADATAWPGYRNDAWRSASTEAKLPESLEKLWSVSLGDDIPAGPIRADWQENPFVKGPLTPPVAAGGKVFVARPDQHEVVALDAEGGRVAWRFVARGRIDTPPTIHRGLCLFGTKAGWVYCLRADSGQVVWQMQAAPLEERIVAYGQVESPWPVPGSILAIDGTAYFAAGRQPLADGGILVFAVDAATGKRKWVSRLDTVPQKGFYRSSGLEFDNFDLLQQEEDGVAMSRWVFDRDSGKMNVKPWHAFLKVNTGEASAWVPRGCWSYAPRHQQRTKTHHPKRALVTFRDNRVVGCSEDRRSLYRRDFNLEGGEKFDPTWITGWAASRASRTGKVTWPSDRLAEKAAWKVDLFAKDEQAQVEAMVLAGDEILLVGSEGALRRLAAKDGSEISRQEVGQPIWDGMAVAYGRVFLSTADGRLICLGAK